MTVKMKDFGKAFRKIRKDRNMSQEDARKDIIPRSTLSDFERGKIDIKLSSFYFLIRNLNVSFQEFWYIVNNYDLTDFEKIWGEATTLYYDGKLNDLKALLLVMDSKKEAGGTYEELEYLMLKNLVGTKDSDFELTPKEKGIIIDHLMSNKAWTSYELVLYGNVLNSFDVKTIRTLSDEVLRRTSLYRSIPQNRVAIIRLLFNTISEMLGGDDLESAIRYQNEVESLLTSFDMYEKTIFHFTNGAIDFYRGKKSVGKEAMKEAIAIFRKLKNSGLADNYQESYDEIVGISENL